MQIQRLNDGDFLVHIECDLRSVHERKMFVAKDENGELRNPIHALCSAFGYPQKRMRFFGGYAVSDKLITLPLWSGQHQLLGIE